MIENIQQLISWEPPFQETIIDKGILLPQTRLIIFGQAKSWKSMLAMHTAFSLANGTPWFGFKTTKCLIFHLQVELPKSAEQKRVIKYAKNANSYPTNVAFKTASRLKIDTSFGLSSLSKDVEEVKARFPAYNNLVLILDPLYLLMAGHISDEYDAKKFLENVNDVKEKYGLAVILIHHTRLTRLNNAGEVVDLGPEEMMGSSYLNNWCDTAVKVRLLNPYTGSDLVKLTFELTRNAEDLLPSFEIQWSRATLLPTIAKRTEIVLDDPSVRDLED